LDKARRLAPGCSAISRRMNPMSDAVTMRPRCLSCSSMPGTIADTNVERKSYQQFYYAAGLTRRHAGAA
jgi:hypothetical protein